MIGFIILIIVSLLPFISTWITSPQDIFIDNDYLKSRKEIFKKRTSWRLTKKGWIFLGIAFLTILFSWIQYNENIKSAKKFQNQLSERDSINRLELRIRDNQSRYEQRVRDSLSVEKIKIRDSLASAKVENGKNETILALAKYSLRYDSSQNVISKLIKDSARKTVIQPIDPVLGLCYNGLSRKKSNSDSLVITIRKCAEMALCKDINIEIYFVVSLDSPLLKKHSNFLFATKEKFIEKDGEMRAGEYRANDFYLYVKGASKIYYVFAWVVGTYKNSDKTKIFDIDKVYFLDTKANYTGNVRDPEEIKSFIIKNDFK